MVDLVSFADLSGRYAGRLVCLEGTLSGGVRLLGEPEICMTSLYPLFDQERERTPVTLAFHSDFPDYSAIKKALWEQAAEVRVVGTFNGHRTRQSLGALYVVDAWERGCNDDKDSRIYIPEKHGVYKLPYEDQVSSLVRYRRS
jgi:hypothetical protein